MVLTRATFVDCVAESMLFAHGGGLSIEEAVVESTLDFGKAAAAEGVALEGVAFRNCTARLVGDVSSLGALRGVVVDAGALGGGLFVNKATVRLSA
eukprot:4559270-Prymnesium_polylepis.1